MKLDAALTAVEVTEAEVHVLYQSMSQVEISLEGYSSQPCEAFICGLNPGEKGRVYAAINLTLDKKVLVYSAGNFGVDRGRYETGIQTALDFLEPLGFQMKEVNLNYSAAMRQVILKGIVGIALPGSAKPEWRQRLEQVVSSQEEEAAAAAKEAAQKALKPQVSIPPPPEKKPVPAQEAPVSSAEEKKSAPAQTPAAPPPTERRESPEPSAKKGGGDDVSAMLRVEIARLQDELEGAMEQSQRFKLRISNLEAELGSERSRSAALAQELHEEQQAKEEARAETAGVIASLQKERDELAGQAAAAHKATAASQAKLAQESERLRADVERTKQKLAEAVAEQARQREAAERLRLDEQESFTQKLHDAEAVLAKTLEAKTRLEKRCAELEAGREEELARLAERIEEADLRGDLRLRQQRQSTAMRLDALRRTIDSLWEQMGDEALPAGDELLQLLSSPAPPRSARHLPQRKQAAETVPDSETAALPRRRESSGESSSTPPAAAEESVVESPAETPGEEGAAIEPPAVEEAPEAAQEDTSKEQVAALLFPQDGLPAASESATAEASAAETAAAASSPPSPPPAWGRPTPTPAPAESFTSFDMSGGFGGESATTFVLDESQGELTLTAASLLEVHRSANFQRFAPMGGMPEEGRAYVCAYEEGGGERVVAILEMTRDLRRYVYVPGDPGLELPLLVRSALTFVEDIGFFMLEEQLPKTVEDRRSAMEEWARFLRWDD